jgi:hypothetical protein
MKHIATFVVIGSLLTAGSLSAQHDTTRSSGSMHFKTIRIIGNDTVVNEKHINLNPNGGSSSFHFNFEHDFDTLIQEYRGDIQQYDTLSDDLFFSPFERKSGITIDSMIQQFRFRFPDTEQFGGEQFRFEFPELTPENLPFLHGNPFGDLFTMNRSPNFSVEDVAIYPETNRVRDFNIKSIPGTNILIIEAKLDNKNTEYTVYDDKGNNIHYEQLKRIEGDFSRILKMDELKNGTYFVEIKNGKSTKKKRITIR